MVTGTTSPANPTQILTAIEKAIRHQHHIMEKTKPTSDQKPKITTYPCSGKEGGVSKINLNFTGAPTTGQSQQQLSTTRQNDVCQASTATQLHVCQQRSKLGQETPKKNQERQNGMKKNHKRHKESLAPHVDVPVNVNNVEPKNSTRSTMFQGLQVEQSQRQVGGILQKDKKTKEKKEEDEKKGGKKGVEKKAVKKGAVEPTKKTQIKEELLQEDNWNYEKKEKLKEVTLKQKNEKCRDEKMETNEAVKERIVEETNLTNQEMQNEINETTLDYPSSINGELNGRGTRMQNARKGRSSQKINVS